MYILTIAAEVHIGITGLPDVVENGTTVELTCRVDRIDPPFRPFQWSYDGRNFSSGFIFWQNDNDETYTMIAIEPFT